MSLPKRKSRQASKRRSTSKRKSKKKAVKKSSVGEQRLPEAWQVPKSKMLKQSEYEARTFMPLAGKWSRTIPMETLDIPIGTWMYEDRFKGADGHLVEQLRLLDPKKLIPSEGANHNVTSYRPEHEKKADVERYIGWLKAGKRPPPISVIELGSGRLRIVDGHRRWAAALKAGTKIPAWVSPIIEVKRDGYTAKVGLTHELAVKQAIERGELVPKRATPAWREQFKWVSSEDRLPSRDTAWWRWMKLSKPRSGNITIYRGVSKEKGTWADKIREGDWVTLSKKQATEMYAQWPNSKVLERTIPLSHVVEASTNSPLSQEFFYVPE